MSCPVFMAGTDISGLQPSCSIFVAHTQAGGLGWDSFTYVPKGLCSWNYGKSIQLLEVFEHGPTEGRFTTPAG